MIENLKKNFEIFNKKFVSWPNNNRDKFFKKFVENSIKKSDALPFKIPKNINLVIVDADTGLRPDNNTKRTILESFKTKDNFFVGLENQKNKDKLGINDSQTKEPILKFY